MRPLRVCLPSILRNANGAPSSSASVPAFAPKVIFVFVWDVCDGRIPLNVETTGLQTMAASDGARLLANQRRNPAATASSVGLGPYICQYRRDCCSPGVSQAGCATARIALCSRPSRTLPLTHVVRRPPSDPQFNIAYPPAGTQKKLDIDDENKLRAFYDKRISAEVDGEHLGEEFKGYIVKIMGGHDKQGFAMKQGVLTNGRVQVLMSRGQSGFLGYGRRNGERRRKSVRGCIVSHEISSLNLVIVKKGENDIPGLTDTEVARPRGPKRASKIRKMFNLTKDDDVRHYVKIYGRKIEKDGKTRIKCPKIQRLVTPQRLQRKRAIKAEKMAKIAKRKSEQAAYHKVIVARMKEERERRSESMAKKRAIRQASQASRDA